MILPSKPLGVIASSRPRVIAVAAGFAEGDLPFADITTTGFGDPVTVPKSGTIHISASQEIWGGAGYIELYKDTPSPICSFNIEGPYEWSGQPVTVSAGDELTFNCETFPTPDNTIGTIYIRNDSISGSLIETISVNIPSICFLTTAVVRHMGLLDDGPELTAMRLLREYYRDVPGYNELIQEYYTNSSAIIGAINASNNASVEYDYIYNTVTAVMNHVNAEEWQQAHDLYLALYNDLKDRYLG
jgi:hypothetical protein